jgi:hypothetical protein
MRYYTLLSCCLTALFLLATPLIGAESGTETQSAAYQSNVIVGSLMALVAIKFSIAGTLGYLWYRKSKYKKQKVILDV